MLRSASMSCCWVVLGGLVAAAPAMAGECTSGECGTPEQSGGTICTEGICECDGGVCVVGSILVAMTDRGDTYQFADDQDGDGIEDEYDNCPFKSDFLQVDGDLDGVGDVCDLCPSIADPMQRDLDGDRLGDECDLDLDGDGLANGLDNCSAVPNLSQLDSDGNGIGDVCDADWLTRCELDPSGTNCNDDPDGDGVPFGIDNCPTIGNPISAELGSQLDTDGDGAGDACDLDLDGDLVPNWEDNCPLVSNQAQLDLDRDGLGDAGDWAGGPQSCDREECYVIGGDAASCLSPNTAFQIKLGMLGRSLVNAIRAGDEIRVTVFTNRLGQIHDWMARFDDLPKESDAALANAKMASATIMAPGSVKASPQLFACSQIAPDGSCLEVDTIRFKPDAPGRYVIKVAASLRGEDPLGPSTATASLVVDVGGESQGGCTAGASSPWAAVVLALGFVTRLFARRR